MQCVGAVGNGFIRSVNRVRHTECMNAFPTRGVGRFGYDEAPEPYPGRWTHHVMVGSVDEIDGELLGWIQEAAEFPASKR